jgi:DNA topoisomerase III
MGDHPPITPTVNVPNALYGDEVRVYEYITKYFLATISPDAKFSRTNVLF